MVVGILTTFANFRPEFSLCSVVKSQLQMLIKYGYQPVLFVLDTFEGDVPEGTELRKVIPQLVLEPYGKGDLSHLGNDSEKARVAMVQNMADIDVCLTHDIIFINSYLPYNLALNEAIDSGLGKIKWLHWMHSAPSLRPQMDGSPYDYLYTLPKNSRLIYMNNTDVIRAAEMYGVFPKDVRVIHNPTDIRELQEFHPLSRKLVDMFDLMSADFVCTYPLSTTRMNNAGKQLSKVIRVMGKLKERGASVRLIVPNAHANAEAQKTEIEQMYFFAMQHGIEKRELIFTSLIDAPEWEHGVPHKVVKDMFSISNLFIFPSVSENCPLILMEAMAYKCLLVLNRNFPAMKDFALENALYFNFGSLVETPTFPNGEDNYFKDVATLIISAYDQNTALKAHTYFRQHYNSDYIFKRQLEPAIKEIYYENL